MDLLTVIYLIYSFVALYFLFFFFLIYVPNRKEIFSYPKLIKKYSLSIVIPCYNEEEHIGGVIQSLLDSDYGNLRRIIVVDDCSTDNSYEVIKNFAKKNPKVIALKTPKNTGKASGAKNYGAKIVDTDLIGFTDADSYPQKDAIRKMMGFFNDKQTGAVTSVVLVKKRGKFIERLQSREYKIIAFTRKLLDFVDAIYVTPGPLTIYKKSAFDEVNGFDENNMTEDIEITWNLISRGYVARMCAASRVYTVTPNNFKTWFNQRIRWNIGGIQSINKHKKAFLKRGMLGSFILPFFILSWFLGLFGLIVLSYRVLRSIIIRYLSTTYSIQVQTSILSLREINLTPSVLIFFGIIIFLLNLFFTLMAFAHSKEKEFKKSGVLSIIVYMFVYLLAYPVILITSAYKFFKVKGEYSW